VIIVGMHALGVTDDVAWQRDWESGSYVELSRQVANLKGVKIRESIRRQVFD
jgi:hypothetical protein